MPRPLTEAERIVARFQIENPVLWEYVNQDVYPLIQKLVRIVYGQGEIGVFYIVQSLILDALKEKSGEVDDLELIDYLGDAELESDYTFDDMAYMLYEAIVVTVGEAHRSLVPALYEFLAESALAEIRGESEDTSQTGD